MRRPYRSVRRGSLRMDLLTPLGRPFLGEVQAGGVAEVLDRRTVVRPGRIELFRESAEMGLRGDFEGQPLK